MSKDGAEDTVVSGDTRVLVDDVAFIAFVRERVSSALRGGPSVGEQRLLDAVHRTLNDYEAQKAAAALSPTSDEEAGVAHGLRWALEVAMWTRFADHPDYRREWRP
ncbi:hypothetical protein [Streptomyces anulatus]|uniref:hypothetical protein n=1 Tax=Streptomyces anulatus TaxID=1892 RepID=UPI0037DD950D|nr:hypothetical protein OHB50_39320 [Streptomyces anulatus]